MERAEQNLARIAERAASFGVSADSVTQQRIAAYVDLLLLWNRRVNLTGATTANDVIDEHLVDSLAMAVAVPVAASVVDVGSGGGLPAIPFALVRPDVRLALVEPRAKRVAFLHTAVRELSLGATVIRGRAETLRDAEFDVASSLATFPPAEWLGVGRRVVKPRGLILVFAAGPIADDPRPEGVELASAMSYATGSGRRRWLGVYRSTWNTGTR